MPDANRGPGYFVPARSYHGEEKLPALKEFRRQVDVARDSVGGDDYILTCRSHFADLLRSDFLQQFVNLELGELVADPMHSLGGGATSSTVNIVLTRDWTLSVRVVTSRLRPSSTLWSSAEHTIFGVAPGAAALTYEYLEQPEPEPCEVFDPDRSLLRRGERTIEPGATAVFRAGRDFLNIVSAERPSVVMIFTSTTILPFRWEYDLRTLAPVRQIASYQSSSRIDIAMRLLAAYGDVRSVPLLEAVAGSEDHFLRWNAVRSVMALDARRGLELLRAATRDDHPHVREAAARSLAALDRGRQARQGASR